VGPQRMSCEAREGALGDRGGPTIIYFSFTKVLGVRGAPFPHGGVRFLMRG
jgi:hypothetical protein